MKSDVIGLKFKNDTFLAYFFIDLCRIETWVDSTQPLRSQKRNTLYIVLYRFSKAILFLLTVSNMALFSFVF